MPAKQVLALNEVNVIRDPALSILVKGALFKPSFSNPQRRITLIFNLCSEIGEVALFEFLS